MATTKKSTNKKTTSKSSAPKQTDALALLKQDHDEVKKMFGQLEKAKDESKKGELGRQICQELTIHAQIEEQIFYPEVKSLPEMEDMVLESLEEHRQMKELVGKARTMQPSDEHFEPDMKVLKEDTEHHVQEEEKDMFPKVKKAMDKDRLVQLGESMKRQKEQLKMGGMPGEQRVREDVQEVERALRR